MGKKIGLLGLLAGLLAGSAGAGGLYTNGAPLAIPPLTGNERIPADTNLPGGAQPQTEAITVGQLATFIGGGGGGGGTVTSVALTAPSFFTVTGSPITGAGTLAISANTQTANTVLAGPASAGPSAPTFRTLVAADLPLATTGAFGAVKPDGSTITISGGVISAVGGGGGSVSLTANGNGVVVSPSPITGTGTIGLTSVETTQTGASYTYQTTDIGATVTRSNAGAMTDTLPQATGSFAAGTAISVWNKGAGTDTITPTTSTVNGQASIALATNTGCTFISDGTNWQAGSDCSAYTIGPSGFTMTGAITLNNGLVGTPGITFADPTTGLYRSALNTIAIANNGVATGSWNATGNYTLGNLVPLSIANGSGAHPRMQVAEIGSGFAHGYSGVQYTNQAGASTSIYGSKSHATTLGTQTAVTTGDQLLNIFGEGSDGTNFQDAADIQLTYDGTGSAAAGIVPGRIVMRTATAAGTMTDGWKIDKVQHIIHLGTAPTCTTCGTGGTLAGNDQVGRITEGTTPGTTVTVTFNGAFVNAPVCRATDETSGISGPVSAVSTSAVTFTFALLTAADKVSYSCEAYE